MDTPPVVSQGTASSRGGALIPFPAVPGSRARRRSKEERKQYITEQMKKRLALTRKDATIPGFTTDSQPVHAEAAEWDTAEFHRRRATPSFLIELPDIRQLDDWSCGAATSAAVGTYYRVGPKTLDGWKQALGTNNDTEESSGTPPDNIVTFFNSLGCRAVPKHNMTLAELRDLANAKIPVICPIQEYGTAAEEDRDDSGHYVAVIAAPEGYIFVQDPSIDNALHGQDADQAPGRMPISDAVFESVWHDKGADGVEYRNFGIAVYPPNGIDLLAKAAANGAEANGLARTKKALDLKEVYARIPQAELIQLHWDAQILESGSTQKTLDLTKLYTPSLGFMQDPVDEGKELAVLVERAAAETDPEPSEAAKKSGNYRKGRFKAHGLTFVIETPRGALRRGSNAQGKPWSALMFHHYGYIARHVSEADGDHVDVFIGPNPLSDRVWVIDQVNPVTRAFDEHKILMGFDRVEDAQWGYLSCYEPGWNGMMGIRELTWPELKDWLKTGDTSTPIVTQTLQPADAPLLPPSLEPLKDSLRAYVASLKAGALQQIAQHGLTLCEEGSPGIILSHLVSDGADNLAEALRPHFLHHSQRTVLNLRRALTEAGDQLLSKSLNLANLYVSAQVSPITQKAWGASWLGGLAKRSVDKVKEFAKDLASSIASTFGKRSTQEYARPQEGEEPLAPIEDRLSDIYPEERIHEIAEDEGYRAEQGAKTETAAEAGTYTLTWESQEGACDICEGFNGKEVKPGEPFGEDSQGRPVYHPLVHPHCRCRLLITDADGSIVAEG